MGTQVAIAEQIVEGKGDFILALKANQDSLFQQVMNYVDEHISDDFAGVPSERGGFAVCRHQTASSGVT